MKKLTAAHVLLILALFAGLQLITGIFVLAGIGWAIIASGIVTLAFAAIIARGLNG